MQNFRVDKLLSIFVVFNLVLCVFYMSDPLDNSWGAEFFTLFKYLPVIALAIFFPFFITTLKISFSSLAVFFLFSWMLVGSILTLVDGFSFAETFLGRSLCMFAFFSGFWFFYKGDIDCFIRGVYLIFSLVFLSSIVNFLWALGVRPFEALHVYHEEVFLFYMMSIVSLQFFKGFLKWGLFFWFVFSCFLTFKNTGFIIGFLAIFHMFFMKYRTLNSTNDLIIKRVALFFVLIIFLLSVTIVLTSFSEYLPSGSPEVRLKTYLLRYEEFMFSPIVGANFIGTPLLELETKWGSIEIPSHSDFLDIIAFSGFVGGLLFLYPVFFIIFKFISFKYGEISKNEKLIFLLDFSFSCVISVFFVLLVNPLLNQPKISVFYWFSIGLSLAILVFFNSKKRECYE